MAATGSAHGPAGRRERVRQAQGERRAYPRHPGEGVSVYGADDARPIAILDIAPYGARLVHQRPPPSGSALDLRIEVPAASHSEILRARVVENRPEEGWIRVLFQDVSSKLQRWILRLAKASLVRRAITDSLAAARAGAPGAFVGVTALGDRRALLQLLRARRAPVALSAHHHGRTIRGSLSPAEPDPASGASLVIDLAAGAPRQALGPRVECMLTAAHDSFLLDARVLEHEGRRLVLGAPRVLVRSDRRRSPRRPVAPDEGLCVEIGERSWPLVDLSADGFAARIPADRVPPGVPTAARLVGPEGVLEAGTVLFRAARDRPVVGAAWIERGAAPHPGPNLRESVATAASPPSRLERAFGAQALTFEASGRTLAGSWLQTGAAPRALVVIPPAWARSKESTALLAQLIAASFAASGADVAILRFDYSDSVGQSTRHPEAQLAGREALMLRPSQCVQDIRAAIAYGRRRADGPALTALLGMSFSGPLCLRAAVEDPAVTHLVQYMGASDIHDLTRTASGGIDFVNRYRAGLRGHVDNVLGQLSYADVWCADGLEHRLLFLLDAQRDAARLDRPVLWIHGSHDAFVNPDRVRRVLQASRSPDARLVEVPYGHIPTQSDEALAASAPLVEYLLEVAEAPSPQLALPDDASLSAASRAEWAAAPRVEIPCPEAFWREYMAGADDDELGFDVLAMTEEYAELMDLQAGALELRPGARVVDLGGGPGHALPHLAAHAPGSLQVHACDLVPDLLQTARDRGERLGLQMSTQTWDAEHDPLPAALAEADGVLMSLFLSVLTAPERLLERLHAALPPGAVVIASSILPDADLSAVYVRLVADIESGAVAPPPGMTPDQLVRAVRSYMSSAAWILRLAEQGRLQLFTPDQLRDLFTTAGFRIDSVERCFGEPRRAVLVRARKPAIPHQGETR